MLIKSPKVKLAIAIFSWISALWISKVFLVSLTYKFTDAPITEYIFNTIADVHRMRFGDSFADLIANYGAYFVGSLELLASALLLLSGILWLTSRAGWTKESYRRDLHNWGGLLSALIMVGAVFYHITTPLGIEIVFEGKSDGGSLFYASVAILTLGSLMTLLNNPANFDDET